MRRRSPGLRSSRLFGSAAMVSSVALVVEKSSGAPSTFRTSEPAVLSIESNSPSAVSAPAASCAPDSVTTANAAMQHAIHFAYLIDPPSPCKGLQDACRTPADEAQKTRRRPAGGAADRRSRCASLAREAALLQPAASPGSSDSGSAH